MASALVWLAMAITASNSACWSGVMPYKISRKAYASMFGPTTGDKVRLADTELFIEVEKDFTTYGDEV